MKPLFMLFAAGTVLFSTASYGAETAQARLFCYSLRFAEGTTYGGTLDLSTISGTSNGELRRGNGAGAALLLFAPVCRRHHVWRHLGFEHHFGNVQRRVTARKRRRRGSFVIRSGLPKAPRMEAPWI